MERIEEHILKFPAPEAGHRTIWEEVGLPPPEYEDERNAPPVDRAALQALVDKKLPEDQVRELYRLTLRFRSWADALIELDLASLKEEQVGPRAD